MSRLNSVALWDTLLIDQLTLIELKCTRIMMPTLDMFHIALCICAGYVPLLHCQCMHGILQQHRMQPACYSTGSLHFRVNYPSDLLLLGLVHLSCLTSFKGALPVADHAEAASAGQARDPPPSHPARAAPAWHC